MRSYLPHHPVINALSRCANNECDNREAEQSFTTLKMCTACRSVSYCSVDCQKAHHKDRKHQCKDDAQCLKNNLDYLATYCVDNGDDGDDDALFQSISPKEECPICTLPLPIDDEKNTYMKRIEMNDSEAIDHLSQHYQLGQHGFPKDLQKAFDLCLRAAELGSSNACCTVAKRYEDGVVVPTDVAKAREYRNEAAKKGNICARHHLGIDEYKKEKHRVASRHWLISAAAGYTNSMGNIAELYRHEVVTKKEFSVAFASYSNVHKDEWSIEREAAVAAAADETRRQNSSS